VKRKVRGNAWEVFVDSFGWIALGNRDDAYHEQAAALYRDLKQQGARMVTTDDVLVEVCNGLSRLRLRHFARQLIAQIEIAKQQGALEVIHVTEDLFAEGLALFLSRPDKEWNLTDCISFVVMEKRGIRQAFTADKHFVQAGFEALLLQR